MHVTKKRHNNKEYEIITDDPITYPFLIIRSTAGRLIPILYIDDGRKCLDNYLYGYTTVKLNGNDLDYRRENVKPFKMSDYNIKRRTYKNDSGIRGVFQRKSGLYYFVVCRNYKIWSSRAIYKTAQEASDARKKYIDENFG